MGTMDNTYYIPWNLDVVGFMERYISVHRALITHCVYTDFDNISDLEKLVRSLSVEVLFNGFTAFMPVSNKNVIATESVLSLVIAEVILVVNCKGVICIGNYQVVVRLMHLSLVSS
ncbi:uncharacterized protein EDB93DRAFT_1100054 [Suillus bovinus]|uniref:uncharacterized protein n=1 Tax=Suillus bovinus TaxID=48563 RepID=UPI001B87C6EF|nr:uncharacterized protein EDB93DRAFT_1100054 [Suillus bovinus]KAG2158995.1 hypothetical protein EDB93DRAFT_1100054 [Suillus bovinus]